MNKREIQLQRELEEIFNAKHPLIDQLANAFHAVIQWHLEEDQNEIELLRAMADKEGLVRAQIKHSTLQYAVSVLDDCYYRAVGQTWRLKERSDE
jgi:hypothetical protein